MVKQALEIALYAASLVTSVFGALTFPVLVAMYVTGKRRSPVLLAFTIALAASFVINLTLQIAWVAGLSIALRAIAAILPALILHLVYSNTRQLRTAGVWRALVIAAYPISLIAGWNSPAIALSCGAVLGVGICLASRMTRHWWIAAILAAIAVSSAISIFPSAPPFVNSLPDLFVFALFAFTLYYEERLVFFDLVIKRGAMFLVALTGFTVLSLGASRWLGEMRLDWMKLWIGALALTPFWMAAPWVSRKLGGFLDRTWLGRRYSMEEAELKFSCDIQTAISESDLRNRAAQSLAEIFGSTTAGVWLTPHRVDSCDTGSGISEQLSYGRIAIHERSNGAIFLSDDHRLLRSLARTLGVVLENVRFREREQSLRHAAARAELKALRAQINPHFLFNALNAIAGLIGENPRLADETVERLARVFRYVLSKSENEWVRLDEEMDFVNAYLSIEQARFGERLSAEIEIEREARAVPIPAMTIQPLVENAIKHGISMSEQPGKVAVRAAIRGDHLRVEVFDNGPGFGRDDPAGDESHALRNIVERLSGYYGSSARLWWEGGEGTRVFIEFPVSRHTAEMDIECGFAGLNANSDRRR